MNLYYRVFGASEDCPDPEHLLGELRGRGLDVRGSFVADEAGWWQAELQCGSGPPVVLERFLAGEEGVRAELSAWAAYVETCDHAPRHLALMERIIQSGQIITVCRDALD